MRYGASRQSIHNWKARFEQSGLTGLEDQSRRPKTSLQRMPAEVESLICPLRREHPRWGARRLVFELRRRGVDQAAVDEWVRAYNFLRPHQALDMATPASLFRPGTPSTPATDIAASTPASGSAITATSATVVAADTQTAPVDAIADGDLVGTWPSPLPHDELANVRGARPATSPLPQVTPSGAVRVQRRIPADGITMVARQRLRVGRTHAGKVVTVIVEDTHFRVLDGDEELSLHARNPGNKPVRITAYDHRGS